MYSVTKKGFTLIEILVAVGILAILTAIAIPVVNGIIKKNNDKADTQTAEMYTSYMTRFSTEEPKTAAHYSHLGAKEKKVATSIAGRGLLPGQNAIDRLEHLPTDEKVWEEIRLQACTAIKMFDNSATCSADYCIQSPKNTDKHFIYYVLTGTIKVENVEELTQKTNTSLANGEKSALNYWVALDIEAGSRFK